MTREEARKAAEVMLAYADGKEIEFRDWQEAEWLEVDESKNVTPSFNWLVSEYRVKQGPAYRPFKDKEECWAEMQKHQPFGWKKYKSDGELSCITFICDETNFIDAYEKLTFADGTPFGIKEK